MPLKRQKRLENRFNQWFIRENVHVWLGFVTLIAGAFLVWALHTESEKNRDLREQIVVLTRTLNERDLQVAALQQQVKEKEIKSVTANSPIEQSLNQTTTTLKDKINKVQSTLIKNNSTPIKQIEYKTKHVDRLVPVDKELNTMMQESYCNSSPNSPSCKKVNNK